MKMFSFDLVIVEAGDIQRRPVGALPVSFEGDDATAAHRTMMIERPVLPLKPGLVVGGVIPHQDSLAHLFGPGAPFAHAKFEPFVGPSTHIESAIARMKHLASKGVRL